MLAPLSWLKEYVNVTLSPKQLGERLTEIGLGTEKITTIDNDTIFEFEITPNRPDLLSILGIAREIAAVEKTVIKLPKPTIDVANTKPKKILPLIIKTDFSINPRFTGIIIEGIKVGESPSWLKDRLIKIGQRPINNIVDITNYVMFELGNPIHAFDYDKIEGHTMQVRLAKEGEGFKSVDGITYQLPKDAVVIQDKEIIIDLCGIKGGFNSGTFEGTKTIFIRVPVEIPSLIRRASQRLSLRSEASSIFERGVNSGGTIDALNRCVSLVLDIAGGQIVSNLYDLKKEEFKPWKLKLRLDRLCKILGIEIPTNQILQILQTLQLYPKKNGNIIEIAVPTDRNDIKLEEDIIEEIARIYGYNNFPKSLPVGSISTEQMPFYKDYRFDEIVKKFFQSAGFSEIFTYSLISEKDLKEFDINSEKNLRVDTPISREYEYLRPTLKINLLKALRQNAPNSQKIDLFELGKVYTGKSIDDAKEEYMLSGISNAKSFLEIKGIIERLFKDYNVTDNATQFITVHHEGLLFEIPYGLLLKHTSRQKVFLPISKYPPIIEDLALTVPKKVLIGDIITAIKKHSSLIKEVSLLDTYRTIKTFHIVYQHSEKNLTNEEVSRIREKLINTLDRKFNIKIKM